MLGVNKTIHMFNGSFNSLQLVEKEKEIYQPHNAKII